MKIKRGDRIKFKAATRSDFKSVWRVVNGFWLDGRPTVRYHGYSNFVVSASEIQEVAKAEGDDA